MAEKKIKTETDFLQGNSKLEVVQKGKNNPTYQVFHHSKSILQKNKFKKTIFLKWKCEIIQCQAY